MHEVQLGKLIETPQQRDAVHIAIAPVVATMKLHPGQEIGFVDDGNVRVGTVAAPLGIVDPFLKHPVNPEQSFYMFLFPNTITSLRHNWTHPAFSQEPGVDAKAAAVLS